MGISGILMNAIVAATMGVAALGVFNQIMAVYVLTSQVAVGGVHYSGLKHVAEYADDPEALGRISWSALFVVCLASVFAAICVYLASGTIGRIMDSPDTGEGIALASPGLIFFAINKVLLSILNGLRRMKAFAVGQGLRYLLLVAAVVLVTTLGLGVPWLGAVFTLAEAILAVFLLVVVAKVLPSKRPRLDRKWVKTHAAFGSSAFMSGLAMELNARVDVLMLSAFVSDREVGIYSFAAMLGEGLYGLLGVVRNQVNPLLVPLLKERRHGELKALFRTVRRWMMPAIVGLVALVLVLYVPVVRLLFGDSELLEAWLPLIVLCCGILACSGFVPFDTMLIQGGMPGRHAAYMALVVASNVVLNGVLIPLMGIVGAAAATAMSLTLSVVYLRWFVRRHLGIVLGLRALSIV